MIGHGPGGERFGGHEVWRADRYPAAGAAFVTRLLGLLGQAEVGDFHSLVPVQHDVGRLDVAVNDATFVGVGQRLAHGHRDLQRLFRLYPVLLLDKLGDIRALHILHQ